MDIYNLRKIEIILEMPWLQTYNPEINWETGEVKMMRCPLLHGKSNEKKENRRTRREKRVATLEEERIVR